MAKEKTVRGSSGAVVSTSGRVARGLLFVFMLIVGLLTLYPVLYVLFGSFKQNAELLVGGINLFPKVWSIDNFVEAWQQADFSTYTMNSVVIAVGVMLLSLFVTSMAGYVLDRRKFPGRALIYGTFMAFMFINVGSVSLRPLFELAISLHMNTSLFSVIFISAAGGQATYIFLIMSYMKSVPKELDEAATIDGCTFFQTFYKIILPLLRPILATVALLSFRGGWNEYIMPLVFTMTEPSKRPLTVGVNMLKNSGDGAAAWNIMFAGAVIAIVPILLIYIVASRYFIDGLTGGAVKG